MPSNPNSCPTCSGPVRQTVNMVCPDCGTDYAPELDVEAIRARLDAATPGPWTRFGRNSGNEDGDDEFLGHDIEGPAPASRGQFVRVADAELIAHAPTDLCRLLDENARLNAENDDMRKRVAYAAAVVSGDAAEMLAESLAKVRAELDRVIREAAADKAKLAAKVADLEAQIEAGRRVEKGEPCPECGGTISPWRDVWGKVGFHACTSCTWPLPGPDGTPRTAPEMPRPPAVEALGAVEPSGTGSGRGTGVAEASGTAQVSDPLDDLTPWGYDPLTPAQIAAARRALRPAHYREAAGSLRALDYMGAADLLDSVARDLDDEQSADYQNEPEGAPTDAK